MVARTVLLNLGQRSCTPLLRNWNSSFVLVQKKLSYRTMVNPFGKDDNTDKYVREKFGDLVVPLSSGDTNWSGNAADLTAAIIVLDQFTRNMFRGTKDMFAHDAAALGLAKEFFAQDFQLASPHVYTLFALMPFMHAEDSAEQARCVSGFESLRERALADGEDAMADAFASNIKYAIEHKDIVDRFGRFPHRNATLGRDSTQEELKFLETHKGF